MTERERYLETLLFGNPDKIPFQPGEPRESTLKVWRRQGLPAEAYWHDVMREKIGIEPLPDDERIAVPFKSEMIPQFEEKIIEEKERTLIVQDWKGNICEISKEFNPTYLRYPKDFVTRRWISCPVRNRHDWESMKTRYAPENPGRIPENVAEMGKKLEKRSYVIGLSFSGPFWQMREWLGAENLCMLFIDNPEWIREMVTFWANYISRLLEKILTHVAVDFVHISEDMAYKQHAMISPEMTRKFLQPCYLQWNEIIKSNRCPLYMMDSDGYVGELLPVWIESGINACDPVEVAAGNDINEFRNDCGKKMAFSGGIDKRAIAKGGAVIKDEMARVAPVIKAGGYIPCCDHGVPSDVSWSAYLEYCEILARMTGWK